MIGRIRGREPFDRLREHGQRVGTTSLWCTFLSDPTAEPPRVAFAIGRALGPAVVRNRLRRRIREILRTMPLSPGWYVIGARPAAITLDAAGLRDEVAELVQRATTGTLSRGDR